MLRIFLLVSPQIFCFYRKHFVETGSNSRKALERDEECF